MLTLTAEPRGQTKSARNGARREGKVPAVLYGKDVAPTSITVDGQALRNAIKAGGLHRLIQLTGAGVPEQCKVLIKDVQFDKAHVDVAHVDFFRPTPGRRIHVRVPVVVRGLEELTRRGIILEHQMHEADCECLAEDVPEALYIDVASLQPGQHIALGDLSAPANVKISGHPGAVVLAIEAPMTTMIPGEGDVQVTAGE